MTSQQMFIAILMLALLTQVTRQLPLFLEVSERWEVQLQKVRASLAFSLMSLLAFYSLRGTAPSWPSDAWLRCGAIVVTLGVHGVFKNLYLSIGAGTAAFILSHFVLGVGY